VVVGGGGGGGGGWGQAPGYQAGWSWRRAGGGESPIGIHYVVLQIN